MKNLIKFILLLSTGPMSSCETITPFPLLELVTTLSNQLDTKCMELLLFDNMSLSQYEQFHSFFKNMAATHTSKTYTVETYTDVKRVEERIRLLMCNRPLRMTLGTNQTLIPYEKMSQWTGSSLMKPVSLVVMRMSIEEFFRNVSLPVDLITIAAVLKSDDCVELYSVHRVDINFPLQVRKIGFWTPKYGLNLKMKTIRYVHRKFKGKVFRTLSNEFWPYATFQGFMEKNKTWDGIYPRVWRELESILGFTSVILRREEYGLKTKTGRWTGMVLDLLKNEADVIVADITVTHDRVHVLDFVNILSQTRSRIYHQQIGYEYSWNAAFLPFSNEVWLFVVLNNTAITLCLSLLNKMSHLYNLEDNLEPIRYLDYLFFSLQAFAQQGLHTAQSTYSIRILHVATFLTSNIAYAAYGAFLISFLSRDVPRQPFNSFDDLLKDGSYKVLIDYNNLAHVFSMSSSQANIENLKQVTEPFTETHHTNSTSVGLYRICKDKSLALAEKELIMNAMNPGALGCKIIEVKGYLKKVQEGIALRRGSPYVAFIRFYAHRMREAGLVQRIVQNIKRPKAKVRRELEPIRLDQISSTCLYWLSGVLISVFVLLIEICISSKRAKKISQQRRRYIDLV